MPTIPEPTTWTIHLARRHPGKAVAAVLVMVFALFAVAALSHSALVVIVAALLLFAATAEFFVPVTYTLDASGAHVRYLFIHRFLPWSRVRRVYFSPNRIQLSSLAVRNWVESFRGVQLRTHDRAAAVAQVRAWCASAGVTPEMIEED